MYPCRERNEVIQMGGTAHVVIASEAKQPRGRASYRLGFTTKYGVNRLVYFETLEDMVSAIAREKQIKGGSRAKKLKLIEGSNPQWRDLFEELF